jgi:hypothetical protein
LFVSPVTVAVTIACDPVVIIGGGAVDAVTTIGAVVTIVAVDVADTAGLVVDLAVTVTVPAGGTLEGPT